MRKLLIIVLLLSLVSACKNQERFTSAYSDYFDTVTIVISYCDNEKEFQEINTIVIEKLGYYHQLFDIYQEYEDLVNISTINRLARKEPLEVSDDLLEFLLFIKESYKKSDGLVNAGLGSVLKIWHEYREIGLKDPSSASLPPMSLLIDADRHTAISNLVIDEEKKTVYFVDSSYSLDVGALAKGYALDRIALSLQEKNITNFVISVGGDVITVGDRAGQGKWSIGIQDPDLSKSDSIILKLEVKDKAVATSGDYQRFYLVKEVAYSHIINPINLYPADYYHSVTVICEDGKTADLLSTMLFIMSPENAIAYVNDLEDVEACFILKDNSILYSTEFPKYIAK